NNQSCRASCSCHARTASQQVERPRGNVITTRVEAATQSVASFLVPLRIVMVGQELIARVNEFCHLVLLQKRSRGLQERALTASNDRRALHNCAARGYRQEDSFDGMSGIRSAAACAVTFGVQVPSEQRMDTPLPAQEIRG